LPHAVKIKKKNATVEAGQSIRRRLPDKCASVLVAIPIEGVTINLTNSGTE
jgi:hypothetical protein